jgi:hypothetical protein
LLFNNCISFRVDLVRGNRGVKKYNFLKRTQNPDLRQSPSNVLRQTSSVYPCMPNLFRQTSHFKRLPPLLSFRSRSGSMPARFDSFSTRFRLVLTCFDSFSTRFKALHSRYIASKYHKYPQKSPDSFHKKPPTAFQPAPAKDQNSHSLSPTFLAPYLDSPQRIQ